ncbi:hypothetical protein [Bradyrhizobium sp. BR 10261]|uniref:hypothetical protein n=1 Tax=Bradyrhizobium sp. BR 10261 TaxID=2749992 RepID=UPI001C654821|nr:hypothetical protein [Bradyrhizobium sp. BR 10261]MBW7964958.1 hypothetical protein [Bradyrhizobium sp. BR 10261]
MIIKENVVPLRFQTFEELQRNEQQIFAEHHDAWYEAFAKFDLIDATIKDDENELPKLAGDKAMLAKADTMLARVNALADLIATLRRTNEKRDAALFGHGAVAKRSLRFAQSNPDRFYGPSTDQHPPKAS